VNIKKLFLMHLHSTRKAAKGDLRWMQLPALGSTAASGGTPLPVPSEAATLCGQCEAAGSRELTES